MVFQALYAKSKHFSNPENARLGSKSTFKDFQHPYKPCTTFLNLGVHKHNYTMHILYTHLHVRFGEAAGRQIVGVHGHRFLLRCQVFIFIQGKRIDGAFIIQTAKLKRQSEISTSHKQNRIYLLYLYI